MASHSAKALSTLANARIEAAREFLSDVYNSASLHGESTRACVDILRAGNIGKLGETQLKMVSLEFRLGRIAGTLDLASRDDAKRVNDLKPWKLGVNMDTHRTQEEQRAYSAAKSAFSHCAKLAGLAIKPRKARQTTGADASPETVKAASSVADALAKEGVVTMPRASNASDVAEWAGRMAALMEKYGKTNAKKIPGEYREHFEAFIANIKALNVTKPE